MSGAWLNFSIVVLIQLVFFVLFANYQKRLPEVPKILVYGIIVGAVIGLTYDLVLGKYFGLVSYLLGFGANFLLVNAALSYGLFVASILLMQKVSTIHFTIWLSILVAVYETANYFFPVWAYEFILSPLPMFILWLVGYSSAAILASFIANQIFKHPFMLHIEPNKKLG
ncbi:MAG: hypothetical protein AAB388_00160 [Patescibacteria group bacterium]